MSTAGEITELPSPVDAYNTVFQNVHAEVFFQKLASYGIEPQTAQDAHDLLELGAKLSVLPDAPEDRPFAKYSSALDSMLNQSGVNAGQQKQANTQAVYNAATQLAQQPEIYAATVSLKKAEAELTAQQPQ